MKRFQTFKYALLSMLHLYNLIGVVCTFIYNTYEIIVAFHTHSQKYMYQPINVHTQLYIYIFRMAHDI